MNRLKPASRADSGPKHKITDKRTVGGLGPKHSISPLTGWLVLMGIMSFPMRSNHRATGYVGPRFGGLSIIALNTADVTFSRTISMQESATASLSALMGEGLGNQATDPLTYRPPQSAEALSMVAAAEEEMARTKSVWALWKTTVGEGKARPRSAKLLRPSMIADTTGATRIATRPRNLDSLTWGPRENLDLLPLIPTQERWPVPAPVKIRGSAEAID